MTSGVPDDVKVPTEPFGVNVTLHPLPRMTADAALRICLTSFWLKARTLG
jgi:hypothetical protein